MDADALMDRLLELEHDLGKYLLLPLSMLEPEADQAALREALSQALLCTRKSGSHAVPARQLWRDFEAEMAASDTTAARARELRPAVERALGWEAALGDQRALCREDIEADLGAVRAAIRSWLKEL
ncbi:MAG: hypothetical protein OEZ06_21665 [Myxococcales bacterium]|nr:hypothetical protein [Myxococcales bacterium]